MINPTLCILFKIFQKGVEVDIMQDIGVTVFRNDSANLYDPDCHRS